eukprot:9881286-Lingulodinium_polyedra.AAC.1
MEGNQPGGRLAKGRWIHCQGQVELVWAKQAAGAEGPGWGSNAAYRPQAGPTGVCGRVHQHGP